MNSLEITPRLRVDFLPYGKVKVTKSLIVEAVKLLAMDKKFELKCSERELVEYVNSAITGNWIEENNKIKVVLTIHYMTRGYLPGDPEMIKTSSRMRFTRDLTDLSKPLVIAGGYTGAGESSLINIMKILISKVESHVKDMREKIDVFI